MKKILISTLSIFLLLSSILLQAQNYYELSTQESYALWLKSKSNTNFVILDIRTADEYNNGHITNAINIDYYKTDEFYSYISKLDKSKIYLIYCASSGRSGNAIAEFKTRAYNFADMSDMKGGLNSWNSKGYPTTTVPTGVEVVGSKFSINMYPNPSQGLLNIQTTSQQQLKILNAIGNVVYEKDGANGLQQLDLNFLPKGLYIIKLKEAQKVYVEKLIIE